MSYRARRHIHKYHHIELNFGKVWACALPDCSHYMPPHIEQMVIGRNSICWKCDGKMILDPINMKDEHPICNECASINRVRIEEFIPATADNKA